MEGSGNDNGSNSMSTTEENKAKSLDEADNKSTNPSYPNTHKSSPQKFTTPNNENGYFKRKLIRNLGDSQSMESEEDASSCTQDQKTGKPTSNCVQLSETDVSGLSFRELLPDFQSSFGFCQKSIPKVPTPDTRPIYPNCPYSPYGSPRTVRRKTPLRESRRVSVEQSGTFLQLNQYKLLDQIGQGSYGLVKLAYNDEDSLHYAMKILSKRRLLRKAGLLARCPKKTTTPLDRVYREIAVLKNLDHPNIVKLIEVLDDPLEDSLYLVFELVKNGEVLKIPTEYPLDETRAHAVFRDTLQGLEYLHYQRIIHGDLKPSNLLITECGRVKIADLGVCNEFSGDDFLNNGSTAGTPAFRSPETLVPGQNVYSGKAADIWSLGATLYALAYGNVPFTADTIPLLYDKIRSQILGFPAAPNTSDELKDLLRKMLDKDPVERITLPQIKNHVWVTQFGTDQMPTEEENCTLVEVSDDEVNAVVKSIPKLDTLILIKTMLKNHSFSNPFSRADSHPAPSRAPTRLDHLSRPNRSNSAPGAYSPRSHSTDTVLPSLTEHSSNPQSANYIKPR